MKKKKTIISCVFLTLIALTAVCTIVAAIRSYLYDMDPANGVDILEGLEAVLTIMVGAFVVFYELDLFYTVYYFAIAPKSTAKSILNILSNICLLTLFFNKYYKDLFAEDIIAPFMVFAIYIVLRIACFIIPNRALVQKQ